jgi:hypothetical protein
MAKIWVHIAPSITPDGNEAKSALKEALKVTMRDLLVARINKALPDDRFSTKAADKPKGDGATYNAIKITPQLNLKLETKGSQMKVSCDVKMIFEAIKTPNLKVGNLLGQGSKGAMVENRGSGERAIVALTTDALDAIIAPLVKKVLTNPRFTSYGRSLGLPL